MKKTTSTEIAMLWNSIVMTSRVIGGRCGVGAPTAADMSSFIGELLRTKQFIIGLLVDVAVAGVWYFLNWKWALVTIAAYFVASAVRNVRTALRNRP